MRSCQGLHEPPSPACGITFSIVAIAARPCCISPPTTTLLSRQWRIPPPACPWISWGRRTCTAVATRFSQDLPSIAFSVPGAMAYVTADFAMAVPRACCAALALCDRRRNRGACASRLHWPAPCHGNGPPTLSLLLSGFLMQPSYRGTIVRDDLCCHDGFVAEVEVMPFGPRLLSPMRHRLQRRVRRPLLEALVGAGAGHQAVGRQHPARAGAQAAA